MVGDQFNQVHRFLYLYEEGPPEEWYYQHNWIIDPDLTDSGHGGLLSAWFPEDYDDVAVNGDIMWEADIQDVDPCWEGPTGYTQDCWHLIFAEYAFSDTPFTNCDCD